MQPPQLDLLELPAPASEFLVAAAMDVAVAKQRVDHAVELGLKWLLPQRMRAGNGAVDSSVFVHAVVPFLDRVIAAKEASQRDRLNRNVAPKLYSARVPLDRLMGETWRWSTEHPLKQTLTPEELATYLSSDERAVPGDNDHASVFNIPALGLCWSHEGKNRDQFLRDQDHTHLPASVCDIEYPTAERMKLFKARDGNGDQTTWCILDGRIAIQAMFAELTNPLMNAYGVETLAKWPETWPAIERLDVERQRLCRDGGHSASGPVVNLDKLRQEDVQAAQGEQDVIATLCTLTIWRPRMPHMLLFVVSLSIIAAVLFSIDSVPLRMVGMTTGGLLIGFVVAHELPLIRTKRKFVQ